MKILVVSQYYYPEQFRLNDITKDFVSRGHEVVVLTGLPNYPKGRIYKGYRFFRKRREIIDGVKVIRCFEIGRRNNSLFLFLNYISFMFSSMVKVIFIKRNYDIIFSYQLSPITMVFPAIIAKKISKKPLYIYSCDIWPESLKNVIKSEKKMIFKVAKKFSSYAYVNSDHLGITSKSFFDYFANVHKISLENISYIPQHAEDSYLEIRGELNNEVFNFVFMGNIGKAQDIECILDATSKINKNYNFKVHFVGDGSFLGKAKEIVKEKAISNYVMFHGRYPLEDMPRFYKLADACLLTLKGDNLIGSTVPSKLQGYMAAGKPVIGAINGAAKDIIVESMCGVCVNAGDASNLASEMENFINNKSNLSIYAENGRHYFINNFTLDKFMDAIIKGFYKLMEEK